MKLLLMGSQGSIGKRYSAVLKRIGHDAALHDIKCQKRLLDISDYSHIIIATPTNTHTEILNSIVDFCKKFSIQVPSILCEKPVSTYSLKVIDDIPDFQMVFQYGKFFEKSELENLDWDQCEVSSFYDYYETGKDGIFWDLIQVIGLHKGKMSNLKISNESIVWECVINNKRLSLYDMQLAYLKMIQDWIDGERLLTKNQIKKIHKKVYEYQNYYRNTGEVYVN